MSDRTQILWSEAFFFTFFTVTTTEMQSSWVNQSSEWQEKSVTSLPNRLLYGFNFIDVAVGRTLRAPFCRMSGERRSIRWPHGEFGWLWSPWWWKQIWHFVDVVKIITSWRFGLDNMCRDYTASSNPSALLPSECSLFKGTHVNSLDRTLAHRHKKLSQLLLVLSGIFRPALLARDLTS